MARNGMSYEPQEKPRPVVAGKEFTFGAIGLDHGHINGMCNGLKEAGANLKWVYDPDSSKIKDFVKKHPGVNVAASEEQILEDPTIKLVASAAVPSYRGPLGVKVMGYGKDYFADKPPFTSLEQLQQAKDQVKATGRKYAVYYSERLHVESAVFAGQLIERGAIGRVIQVIGMGPHRIRLGLRPPWFFDKAHSGGILCDIGSHQIEQFLHFTGAQDAKVVHSKVGNYKFKEYPGFEDFGDASLIADNGATNYFRVDWLTPDGLGTWGDGRLFILGTEGFIELRKYIDIGRDSGKDHLYIANQDVEKYIHCAGKVGYPFFGQLILDCLNGTEHAMTQEHAFKAAELCLLAQRDAIVVEE